MVHPSRCSRIVAILSLGVALMCASTHAQGLVFSTPTNISKNGDYSWNQQVAVDAAGNINVVWEDDTATASGYQIILFSRSTDGGATFSTPKPLSNASGFSTNPRICVDSQGGINVVWQDNAAGNYDVFFSRSSDGGVIFSAPMNLSALNDPASSANPQIAAGAGGNISVVWESDTVTLGIFFSHSTDGGATFSNPMNLTANPTGSLAPQMAVGVDGSINVVWEDDFNFRSHIFYRRSPDGGATFPTPPTPVSNDSGNSSGAQIAVDLNGNINVVWIDDTPGNFAIFFARSTDKGATFPSTKNVSKSIGDSSSPQVGTDANGNIFVAWQKTLSPTINHDVFFARSTDGGVTFSATQNLSNDPAGDSTFPWMTVDAAGGINLAWQDGTPSKANIFFARSVDAGATFTMPPQNLSNDSGASSGVQIASDTNGNLDVVWSDSTPGMNQIFFRRYSDPKPTTPTNQAPVANAGPDQTLDCTGHGCATATLNGSASSDPDGDALSGFLWVDETGKPVGMKAIVQVTVGMGTHTFTLTVTDAVGLTSTPATTHVTVRDTKPPTLRVSLSPNVLWPPNHKLVQITATIQASDVCDTNPMVQLVSITSNDPAKHGDNDNDIQAVGGGPVAFPTAFTPPPFPMDVRSFMLRSERSSERKDRVYTVTYKAKDASGNTTVFSAQVRVGNPHRYTPPKHPHNGWGDRDHR